MEGEWEAEMSFERSNENVIEWLTGEKRILLTFNQQKHVNLLKRLAKDYPEEVDIELNVDGSVFGHVPVNWLRISPPRKVELTEEEKEQFKERMANGRKG